MANIVRSAALSNAASRESARLGDAVVDLTHLFLAVLATGGPAARELGRRGVDLDAAREAVRAQEGAADPGDDDPDTDSIHVEDLHYDLQGELPWTERAGRIGPTASMNRSDLSLLADLLDDDSGVVADLLSALGVDSFTLRQWIDTGARDAEPLVDTIETDAELLPDDAAATTSIQHYIGLPLPQVWEAVSDPRSVIRWVGTPERSRVEAGAIDTTVDRFGQSGSVRLAPSLIEEPSSKGARIVWRERHANDKAETQAGGYYDLRLREADSGTVLDVVRGIRPLGRLSRAMLPIARRAAAGALTGLVQDIAYVSADS